jgi:hypothetical protein
MSVINKRLEEALQPGVLLLQLPAPVDGLENSRDYRAQANYGRLLEKAKSLMANDKEKSEGRVN